MEHHATFDFHKKKDVPADIAARLVDQFSTVPGLSIDSDAVPMFEAFLAVMKLPLQAGIRTSEVCAKPTNRQYPAVPYHAMPYSQP